MENEVLEGLLFGYEECNPYFCDLKFNKKKGIHERCFFQSNFSESDIKEQFLPIALFRFYEVTYEEDPIITEYKKEGKQIQGQLKGKDFTEEILNRLYNCK